MIVAAKKLVTQMAKKVFGSGALAVSVFDVDATQLASLVYFTLPICKESKQAHCPWALIALAACSSAPLSGAAPFLQTCRLGQKLVCHVSTVSRGRSPGNCKMAFK